MPKEPINEGAEREPAASLSEILHQSEHHVPAIVTVCVSISRVLTGTRDEH
jgi:hypothetical protein